MRRYIFTQEGMILGDPDNFMGSRLKIHHITFNNNKPINIVKGDLLFSYADADGKTLNTVATKSLHNTVSEFVATMTGIHNASNLFSLTKDDVGRAVVVVKNVSDVILSDKISKYLDIPKKLIMGKTYMGKKPINMCANYYRLCSSIALTQPLYIIPTLTTTYNDLHEILIDGRRQYDIRFWFLDENDREVETDFVIDLSVY